MLSRHSGLRRITLSAAAFVLAATVLATAPAGANDGTQVTRPNCPECTTARKARDAAASRLERTKTRLREEDLPRSQIRLLDARNAQDRAAVTQNARVLDACKNGCPDSLGVKVKPVTIKSCKECQTLADELAAIRTQIKQVKAEQARIKSLKRTVSLKGKVAIEQQLKKLEALRKAKNKAFLACEKKFCAKPRGDKKKASAIDGAVKDIMKGLEGDKRKKKSGGS